MNRSILALAALAMPAAPARAETPDLDQRVHCAALFGLVARDRNSGVPGAERFPWVEQRGKEFFIDTGFRLIEERALPIDTLKPLFVGEIEKIQARATAAPDRAAWYDREIGACLPLLDATVPAKPAP